MRKLYAPPQLEISGVFTGAFIDNLQADGAIAIFKKHHLENPDAALWYPTHHFMDAMNELADEGYLVSNLVLIGMEVCKRFPKLMNNGASPLWDALIFWESVYLTAHRNYQVGEIGGIRTEKISETHYKTFLTDLYPDHFSYGIAYELTRRYMPKGTVCKVMYDPAFPTRDDHGGDVTVIDFSW